MSRRRSGHEIERACRQDPGRAIRSADCAAASDAAWARGEKGLFWGPASMTLQPRDFVQFFQQLRWFFGRGPRPRFEHFTYWEKFDYWAVLWGAAIMGAAGLILWFPEEASIFLPGCLYAVL